MLGGMKVYFLFSVMCGFKVKRDVLLNSIWPVLMTNFRSYAAVYKHKGTRTKVIKLNVWY